MFNKCLSGWEGGALIYSTCQFPWCTLAMANFKLTMILQPAHKIPDNVTTTLRSAQLGCTLNAGRHTCHRLF